MVQTRRAVRVLLVDPDDRLLLLWHARLGDEHHWAPPGGGVEAGETLLDAAARELREEVGLTGVVLGRPVWLWQHRFSYRGVDTVQHETLFACRLPRPVQPAGQPADLAADGISDARWWSLPDLAACSDEVWPDGLADRGRQLLNGDLDPPQPLPLGSRQPHPPPQPPGVPSRA